MKRKKLMGWKRMAAFAMALTLTLGDGASVGVMAAQASDPETAVETTTEETTETADAAAEVTTEAAETEEAEAESEAASETATEKETESEAASETATEAEAESEAASETATEKETESETAADTEEAEAAEETEDVLLGAEVGVSQVIGLEGKEADEDGTLKSDDGKVEKAYSFVDPQKSDENSSVSNLAGQTKDYLDAATGLYLYNGVYYAYGNDHSNNTCYLTDKVDQVITDTTKEPERDAATGLYLVGGKYYSYCSSAKDDNDKVKCYYFASYNEAIALGIVGADVDIDAAYGKKVADTDKDISYYEVKGKDYTDIKAVSIYDSNNKLTGKALYALKGKEISFDKKHHSITWNNVTNETEISQNGKLYHIGYQVKVNGQDADLTYKADNGQTFTTNTGYTTSNVYAAGEKAIYEVRAIYYTQVKDAKTGKYTYTIAKTGDWSAAYGYANEAVVAAKKTVPQVTGVAAVLKSAKTAEVTWAPVAEASEYKVSYISSDTELQVTEDTWKTGRYTVAVVKRADYSSWSDFYNACRKYENYNYSTSYADDDEDEVYDIRTYYTSVNTTTVNASKTYADISVNGKYTYFAVQASVYDDKNEYESSYGAYSVAVSVVTSDAANVQAVTGLKVENNKDGSFNLKWNPVDDDANIRIYYSTDASAFDNGAYLYGLANARTASGSAYVNDDSVNEAYQIAQKTVEYETVSGSQNELSSDSLNLEVGKKYYFVAVTYDDSKRGTNREDITPYQVTKADGSVVKYGNFTDISAASSKVSATEEMGKLAKPETKSEKNSITMTFDGKRTGVEIYRKSGKKYKKIATTTSSQYVDKDLKADTTYSYKARTYKYNPVTKKTVYSDYVFFSAETSADNYIDVKAVKASKNSVKLTWTKVKGATKYEIYRTSTSSTDSNYSKKDGTASNAKWKLVKTINSAKTVKYTDKKLTSGETYGYKVVAVYKSGKDTKNIFDTAYVVLDLQSPQNVVALLSGSKVKVTWDADKYATKYEVRYTKYNAEGKAYTDDPVVVSTKKANYTIKGLKTGEKAEVAVRAYNGKKWSGWSSSESGKMALATVKSVSAKNVTVKDANGVASTKVKISWKKVSGAAYYRVYRSTNPATIYNKDTKTYFFRNSDSYESIVKESNTDESYSASAVRYEEYKGQSGTIVGTSAIDGGQLQSGVTYYYYVVAYAENGTAYSTGFAKNVSVVFDADASITKITAKKGKTTLTLGKVAGAKKYVVYRSTNAKKGFKQIGTTKKTTYVDKTTKKGKTYYYKVVAVGKNGLKADFETAMSSAKKVKAK